jgi:O-antigen ligase
LKSGKFSLSPTNFLSTVFSGKSQLLLYPSGLVAAQLFFPKGVPLFVVAWLIHCTYLRFQEKSLSVTPFNNLFILLPIGFWILHAISLLYSEDKGFGIKDLETKMAFLILPALFLWSAKSLNKSFFKQVYILLTGVSLLLCWLLSLNDFVHELYARANNIPLEEYPYTNYFFASRLSHFLHPGYFSMFVLMAIVFLFDQMKHSTGRRSRAASIALMIFFLLSMLFLASKSGIIALFLMVLWLIFFGENIRQKLKLVFLGALFSMLILASQLPWVRNSFLDAIGSVENPQRSGLEEKSSSLRMISWRSAWKVWQVQPIIGRGAGDIKNELIRQYKEDGNFLSAEKKLNAHSQVLQSMAALGIPGLLLVLALLLLPFWCRDPEGKLLGIVFVIFGFTESIFETQAGVIFYACLMPFICIIGNESQTKKVR